MFVQFFAILGSQDPVTIREYLTFLKRLKEVLAGEHRRILLPVARIAGEGRAVLRHVRSSIREFLQGCYAQDRRTADEYIPEDWLQASRGDVFRRGN